MIEYNIGQAFWRNLGIRLPELDDWPDLKIERYVTIMETLTKLGRAQVEADRHFAESQQRRN